MTFVFLPSMLVGTGKWRRWWDCRDSGFVRGRKPTSSITGNYFIFISQSCYCTAPLGL